MTTLAAALAAFTSLAPAVPSDLAGCYELARSVSGDVPDPWGEPFERGKAFLSREFVRCLEADGRAVEQRTITFTGPMGGRARQTMHVGSWSVRGDGLRIRWDSDDEGEWEFELFEGGLDVGGELWRAIDLDPAQLRAELEADHADRDEEDVDDEAATGSGDEDEADPGAEDEGEEDIDALAEDDPEDEDVADL